MIKTILAIAVVAALSACSSGSDSGDSNGNGQETGNNTDNNNTGNNNTDNNNTINNIPDVSTPEGDVEQPGGGLGPTPGTKAGSYIGTFGEAGSPQGVYLIDNENNLAGLAINDDGSANSLFGNLGTGSTFDGTLAQYSHQESRPGPADGDFGSAASVDAPLAIDINIVNGQTIESTAESATRVSLIPTAGAITPATTEALAGTWNGRQGICGFNGDINDCRPLITERRRER